MSEDNEKWNSSYVSVTSPDGTQNLDNVSPFSITGPDRRDVAAAIEDAPSISVTRPDQYQTVHNLLNKEEPTPHFQNSGFSPQNQSFQSAGREESGTSRRSVGFADQVRGGVEIAFPSRIDFGTEGEHGGFWARCRATIFSFAVVGMVFYGVYCGGFWAYHLFQQFSFSSKKEASSTPPQPPNLEIVKNDEKKESKFKIYSTPVDIEKIYLLHELDTRPTFLTLPRPSYTDEDRRNRVGGKVVLSVVLRRDGKVGNIKVLRGLSPGLDKQSIETAKKIKFLPGEIGGSAVDVYYKVEFSFNVV